MLDGDQASKENVIYDKTTKAYPIRIDLRRGVREKVEEQVALETPINLYLNSEHVTTVLVTPEKLKEFAVGFLVDERILMSKGEIADLWIRDLDVRIQSKSDVRRRFQIYRVARLITTQCGSVEAYLRLLDRMEKPYVESNIKIPPETIMKSVNELGKLAKTYGLHGAALFRKDGGLVSFAEDVGRHNAVDKAIGEAVLGDVDTTDCFLTSTGRQSADMVMKAARMKIPIITSMAGPIYSGVYAAEKTGVTLACCARGHLVSIYTHQERIV